jgi:DNA polymerase III delta' subunit
MKFKNILCQDKAIVILQKAYASGKAAHAYIFAGQDGIGRYQTARAWAALLLCETPDTETGPSGDWAQACGRCRACRALAADAHPDFFHVYKELRSFTEDGKGKAAPVDMPIDVIREFLIAKVSGRPTLSQRKVFIVSEAQKLNQASQNALLKVLEEPPSYCCIILLCTRLERLLPTIKSRAQIIRFGSIDQTVIQDRLVHMALDPDKAAYLSRLAHGSLGMAQILGKLELEGGELYSIKEQLVRRLTTLEVADCVDVAQFCVDQAKSLSQTWTQLEPETSKTDLGRRAQAVIIRLIISVYHDVMHMPFSSPDKIINSEQQGDIERLSHVLDPPQAVACVFDGFEALRWIEAGVNERLVFERLLLRAASAGIIVGL